MQQILFKIFFGIVLGGVLLGLVMNLYYDIRARSNIQAALDELTSLARKGDAAGIMERQFVKTLVLEGEMPLPSLHKMVQDTLRFALLVRQLPDTTPYFDSVWSEQRFAISGRIRLLDKAGEERFSFTAVMWNRIDNRDNEHWILRTWSDPETQVERYVTLLKKSVNKQYLMMELRDRFLHPAGPLPFLKAQKLQKTLLAQINRIKNIEPLKSYKPEGSLRTLGALEEFWKNGDKPLRAKAVAFLLGKRESFTDEQIAAIEESIKELHKTLLSVEPDAESALKGLGDLRNKLGCNAIMKNVQSRYAKMVGLAYLHAAATPKHPFKLTLHRASNWLSMGTKTLLTAVAKFLNVKEEWVERATLIAKNFPSKPQQPLKALPRKRSEWFSQFYEYVLHRTKVEICTALRDHLSSLLGAIGAIPDPATRQQLYELAKQSKEDKLDVCEVLLKFASPKVFYETAVTEAERILREAGDKKDAIVSYLRKAAAAIEDENRQKTLLQELQHLSSPTVPFCVEPLVRKIEEEGIRTYKVGGRLSLLVSDFMEGVVGKIMTARSLAKQIETLSDTQRRRDWVLTGNQKPPRVFGLLDWIETPFIYPEEVKEQLLKQVEGIISSDTASPAPLFKALKKAMQRKDVKERIKLLALKKVVEKLPSCPQTLLLRSKITALQYSTKEGYLGLLRDLRAVDPSRDITRASFEGLLRRAIAKPQTLKRDQVYVIREYARKIPTAVFRLRKYNLKDEDAKVTDIETILKKIEPLRKRVEALKDAMPLYDESILNECDKLAEELLAPTSEEKKRLGSFFLETVRFKGDMDEYTERFKNDLQLLQSMLEKAEKKQYEELLDQKPPDWQHILTQLIIRHVGCRTYVMVKQKIMLMRMAAKIDVDALIKETEDFLKSRFCLEMAVVQELASTLRGALKEHKKDETTSERKQQEARLLRRLFSEKPPNDLKGFAQKMCEEAYKLVTHPANLRIHLVEKASGFLSATILGGRRQGGPERVYYLSDALEKVVWLKDDTLLPKVVNKIITDMRSGVALRSNIVLLAKRYGRGEKGRRDKAEGTVSAAIAELGSEIAWTITKFAFNTEDSDALLRFVDNRKEDIKRNIINAFTKSIGSSPNTKNKWWEFLELRKTYKLAGYHRIAELRRFRFERFADRRKNIRKLSEQILSLIRGLEEEDYLRKKDGKPLYLTVMEMCYKLRLECDRTYDENEYIHLDFFVVRRLDEDWRQRWVILDVGRLKEANRVEKMGEEERQRRERLMEWRR